MMPRLRLVWCLLVVAAEPIRGELSLGSVASNSGGEAKGDAAKSPPSVPELLKQLDALENHIANALESSDDATSEEKTFETLHGLVDNSNALKEEIKDAQQKIADVVKSHGPSDFVVLPGQELIFGTPGGRESSREAAGLISNAVLSAQKSADKVRKSGTQFEIRRLLLSATSDLKAARTAIQRPIIARLANLGLAKPPPLSDPLEAEALESGKHSVKEM